MKAVIRIAMMAVLLAIGSGCDSLTQPGSRIDQFNWEPLENPEDFQDGADIAGFFRAVNFAGSIRTPNPCYSLKATLDRNDNDLTIHVDAVSTGTPNCSTSPGGFSYVGAVQNLDPGTYSVHIVLTVEGAAPKEFSENVVI